MEHRLSPGAVGAEYRSILLDNVVPFWLRHARDQIGGGISNQLDDAGKMLGNDKFLWSQGRALWTFSALVNRIERRSEWLDFAHEIFRYILSHGRDEQGCWQYRLDETGEVLDPAISIYVDGFVMLGLTEYYRATGEDAALQLALDTYSTTVIRLTDSECRDTAPYETPIGLKTHGLRMLFSMVFYQLGLAARRDEIKAQGVHYCHEILEHFYVPSKDAILEYVTLDGQFSDTPAGRACVPGHGLESMWFALSIFESESLSEQVPTCCRLILRHLELAWDEEYGGLRLALDIDGQSPEFWKRSDYKPWWVQVEALVATAYAYVLTNDEVFWRWHVRVREYAISHYPVPTGEWTQWLDRLGKKAGSAALPVKDPFHLPRGLLMLSELCGRMSNA